MALTNSSQVTLPSLFESRALRSFWKKRLTWKLNQWNWSVWNVLFGNRTISFRTFWNDSCVHQVGSCRIQTKKLVYTSRLLNPANNQSGSRHTLCPSFLLLTSAKYPRLTFISWINRPRNPSWKYFQVQVLCDSDIIYTGIYCRSVILSYINWPKLIAIVNKFHKK